MFTEILHFNCLGFALISSIRRLAWLHHPDKGGDPERLLHRALFCVAFFVNYLFWWKEDRFGQSWSLFNRWQQYIYCIYIYIYLVEWGSKRWASLMKCSATRRGVRSMMRKDGPHHVGKCGAAIWEGTYCDNTLLSSGDRLFYTGPPSSAEELAQMLLQGGDQCRLCGHDANWSGGWIGWRVM